jgi:hypothetical protein
VGDSASGTTRFQTVDALGARRPGRGTPHEVGSRLRDHADLS